MYRLLCLFCVFVCRFVGLFIIPLYPQSNNKYCLKMKDARWRYLLSCAYDRTEINFLITMSDKSMAAPKFGLLLESLYWCHLCYRFIVIIIVLIWYLYSECNRRHLCNVKLMGS